MFREVNARFCEITGDRHDELIGQPLRLLHASDQGFPTEREVGDGTRAADRAAFVEARLRRRSGEVIDVAMHSAPLDPADPERGLVVWMLANTADRDTRPELTAALDRQRLALAGGELGIHETDLVTGEGWADDTYVSHIGLSRDDGEFQLADDDARFLLFACARELLLNVAKHAGVGAAERCLTRPAAREIRLIVSDAGNGFDPEALQRLRPDEMRFGLFSIRERLAHIGGRMELQSAPTRGTRVTLVVPVTSASAEQSGSCLAAAVAVPP
jgi:PAS domain S-box-containing protein